MIPSISAPAFSRQAMGSLLIPSFSGMSFLSTPSVSSPLSSSLGDGILTHWKMDEESGVRVDEVAAKNLTDVNSVGFRAGVNGNAADFNGTTQRLIASGTDPIWRRDDLDFSWVAGVRFDSLGNDMAIVGKWTVADSGRQFIVYLDSGSGQFRFLIKGTDLAFKVVTATVFGPLSINTWYMIEAYKSGTVMGVRVNGANKQELNMTVNMVEQDSTDIGFGAEAYGADFLDGAIDFVEYRDKKLTDAEALELYNSGSWKGYPY